MALSESVLKKLHKGETINLALDYQSKFCSTLAGIKNELSDLKRDFEQLRSDLSITKLDWSDRHGAIANTQDGSA